MVAVTSLLRSFRCAGRGIVLACRDRNMRIMLGAAIAVIVVAALCSVSSLHWAILVLCIGVVLSAEAMNSAVERCIDQIELRYDREVRDIKDLAAGAVLLISVVAAIVGGVVLWPYLAP
jgi:diacylglycerol kinase